MTNKTALEACKNLDRNTLFECKLQSAKKAVDLIFRLQEHFLGESKIVSGKRLGRYKVSEYCDYRECHAHYDAQTKVFRFSRVPTHKTTHTISTLERKAKERKVVSVEDFNIENSTMRCQASHRGGGIEISLDKLGYENEKMTAYQNYLGGGMLGSIGNDCTIREWREDETLVAMADKLARYFHGLTNHEDDEWESATFEENQKRPHSAY